METLYYRINHKNNLELFDNASLVQLKTNLFYELSLTDDTYNWRIWDFDKNGYNINLCQ